MDQQPVSATRYQVLCPSCGAFVPFVSVDGGIEKPEAYRGTATGDLYVLDDELIRYGITTRESALAPAVAREADAGGELVPADDHIRCQNCPFTFALGDVERPPPGSPVEASAFRLSRD